jgi:hypothetical protein
MSRIIGISGKMGSGKDTLAKYINDIDPSFKIKHFADPLKECVQQLIKSPDLHTQSGKKYYIEWLGMTARELLQKFGTAIREGVDSDFWVKLLLNNSKNEDIIIADVRFPNEVKAIKEAGGIIVRIERKNIETNSHISETALDNYKDWNMTIINDYDLNSLKRSAHYILNNL